MTPSSAAPFRLAIVGAGAVARVIHLPGVLASPRITIAALVDPVAARAGQLARDFGLSARIATDVDAIADAIDGALICTPNDSHCPIALALLGRGIPCLVEKPLATSVADAERMCQAAEDAGTVLAVGYTTRYRDEVVLLKEVLQAQRFGRVRRFHYQEGTIGGWAAVSGYTLSRTASGGGVLATVGTHFIDRMLYWFGYPDACSLVDDSQGGPEAACLARFHYGNGAEAIEGTLLLSKTFTLKPGLAIETEQGRIVFPMGRSPLCFVADGAPDVVTVLAPAVRRFPLEKSDAQLQIENFVDACRGRGKPMTDGRQGLLSIRLLQDLYARRQPMAEPWRQQPGIAA